MKNFIFTSMVIFGAFLFLNGCYTYLSLSNGAELADVPYEPYFPPDDPCPPPPPDPGPPPRRPIIVLVPDTPPSPPYQRPKDISDLRNGGEGRNSDTDKRRR